MLVFRKKFFYILIIVIRRKVKLRSNFRRVSDLIYYCLILIWFFIIFILNLYYFCYSCSVFYGW